MALRPLPPNGLPRVTFEARRPTEIAPLRTDIALFTGTTLRGPAGTPVRVEGWQTYETVFGGLAAASDTGHAVKGYFQNGGQIAWILRLAPGATPATGLWELTADGGFAPASLGFEAFRFVAASNGSWGAGLSVRPLCRLGPDGNALVDLDVYDRGQVAEQLVGINPSDLSSVVAERSAHIRVAAEAGAAPLPANPGAGPRVRQWDTVELSGGRDGASPSRTDYAGVLPLIAEEQEPALIVLPDLHRHLNPDDAAAVILGAARFSDSQLDRMIVADAPEAVETAVEAEAWIARFGNDPAVHRAVATYHPWIDMRDPIGTASAPLRRLAPSGHVAGAISRLDRSLGAYVTPANTSLADCIDLARRIEPQEQDTISNLGLNALRCQSSRGIVVWGGRMTRSDDTRTRFVAHRRLIHRIVRALRRTWAPMVFEPNDDALRLAIARSATTLLLEAFHSNVLKGTRPEEAFRVTVDDTVNTPQTREAGRIICEIAIAPATPMEFIHFRVGLSADGTVEFIET
ncbi:MAG: hypothetical protein AB2809_06185 [Candidatus Thiodiazotropha sp.]